MKRQLPPDHIKNHPHYLRIVCFWVFATFVSTTFLTWEVWQGYYSGESNRRADNEILLQASINNDLKAKNYVVVCENVALVNEVGNRYIGTARFSDGNTSSVDFTLDTDGRSVYHYQTPWAWALLPPTAHNLGHN